MDLSIALVNWNNRDYLKQCLQSIEAARLPVVYEVVVADNGSTDGSLEMLAAHFPYVKVVQNGKNVGVARGNNECIRNSSGRFIWVLNNDTLVNRDSVVAMIEFLEDTPGAAAVGGCLLNPDGTLQYAFCSFPTLVEEFLIVSHIGKRLNPYFPSHMGTGSVAQEVDWISSASILVRRTAIESIGLVDEDYFIYSDETDWQYRLAKAGWKVYFLPNVTTIHFGGSSFKPGGKRFTLVYRGRMLFARKHYGIPYQFAQRLMFCVAAIARGLVWLLLCVLPRWRAIARKQVVSNFETLSLCVNLK